MTGNLARAGVRADEYVFSSAGADRLARGLFVALRDRAVELPDDDELQAAATAVRLVEAGPGTVKMSNPPGTHDDVLTAVGMVLADLTASPTTGAARLARRSARRPWSARCATPAPRSRCGSCCGRRTERAPRGSVARDWGCSSRAAPTTRDTTAVRRTGQRVSPRVRTWSRRTPTRVRSVPTGVKRGGEPAT